MDDIDEKEEWMRDGKGRRREKEVKGVYILLLLAAAAPSCGSDDCPKGKEGTTPDG